MTHSYNWARKYLKFRILIILITWMPWQLKKKLMNGPICRRGCCGLSMITSQMWKNKLFINIWIIPNLIIIFCEKGTKNYYIIPNFSLVLLTSLSRSLPKLYPVNNSLSYAKSPQKPWKGFYTHLLQPISSFPLSSLD